MRLKNYQVAALDRLSAWLRLLSEAEANAERTLAAISQLPQELRSSLPPPQPPVAGAWDAARKTGIAASGEPWHELRDGTDRSIPHICLKLPTGGGKTLLAAHGVDRILANHFRRNGGLVLWIVPSDAIYRQTRAHLIDRAHSIRQTLDRASAGQTKIIEKLDGFTRQDVEQKLCVLLLMLQSTGRENKESLKVFRDSGQYLSFFPQDDPVARAALLKQAPNLETLDLADAPGEAGWIKQSLGNTLRVTRPLIVLDEGHRAYSQLARETLAGLNPRFLLELSATPNAGLSNILVNVTGRELKDEEMIKLPIRLDVGRNMRWQTVLQHALDRLDGLEAEARKFEQSSGRYIRPIMLVRVDRTGKDQRDKTAGLIHSEDVFEYLTQKAGIAPEAIRRQTAELKELSDDDLLSPYCSVRVIITKDALREGWDCPFAYVLAVLSRGTAGTALTQMIGRVLRQPQAALTGVEDLDQTHVFCADVEVGDAIAKIKTGLESEGLGDIAGEIRTGGKKEDLTEVKVQFRNRFQGTRIMVPRVLYRERKRQYRDLDFEADVLADVEFSRLSFRRADDFKLADYDLGREDSFTLDIAHGPGFDIDAVSQQSGMIDQPFDVPNLARRMLDVVPNPWQATRILNDAASALRDRGASDEQIAASRLTLVDAIKRDLQEQVDAAAEHIFREKVKAGQIVFKLLASPFDDLNFEFQERYTTHIALADVKTPLLHSGGKPLDRALYDRVFRRDFNDFEAAVALYIDEREAIEWWWRIAARGKWGLQGWMKNKVYPDFLVRVEANAHTARLLVLETKGKHLEGSEDTQFKEKFFKVLDDAYTFGKAPGDVELFADAPNAMRFRILLQEQAWQNDVEGVLTE